MTNWIELAERVEALDGPCRAVDLLIMRYAMNIGGPPETAAHYTASLDAAMTLWDRAERLIINIAEDGITTVILGGSGNTAFAPPCAVTAACLRARAGMENNHD